MRIILLVVVVTSFGKFVQGDNLNDTNKKEKRIQKLPLPWYIIGFIFFCTLNSLIHLPNSISTSAHFVSNWFEITALAAIGLRLDFAKFFKEGVRFLLYGLAVGILQVTLAIVLIMIFKI